MKELGPKVDKAPDKIYDVIYPLVANFNKSFANNTSPSLDDLMKEVDNALVELNKITGKEKQEAKSYANIFTSWFNYLTPFRPAVVEEKKVEKKEVQKQIAPPKPVEISPTATTIPPSAVAIYQPSPSIVIQEAIKGLVVHEQKPATNEVAVYAPSVYSDIYNYLASINYGENVQEAAMYLADKINQVREADKKMKETPVTTREMNKLLGVNLTPLDQYDDDLISTDVAIPGSNIEPKMQRRVAERPLVESRPINKDEYRQLPMYQQLYHPSGHRYSDLPFANMSSVNERIINQLSRREPDFAIVNRNDALRYQPLNPFKLPQSSTNVYDLPAEQYNDAYYDQPIHVQLNPFSVGLPRANPQDRGQSMISENQFTL